MKFRLSRSVGVPADVVGAELERIREENESLTASSVVDAARPDDAPLHPAFEWDDSAAAEQYRLQQARTLIRAVQVVYEEREPQTVYLHVPSESRGEGDYAPMAVVVQDKDRLARAMSELNAKLGSVQGAINEVVAIAEQANERKAARKLRQVASHVEQASALMHA